jgi:hypothetical protein
MRARSTAAAITRATGYGERTAARDEEAGNYDIRRRAHILFNHIETAFTNKRITVLSRLPALTWSRGNGVR